MSAITFDYDAEARGFRLTVEGQERVVPALEGRDLGEWHGLYARAYANVPEELAAAQTLAEFFRANDLAEDRVIDALLAYDRAGALGGRDWLEEHLTMEQVMLILRRIARTHA